MAPERTGLLQSRVHWSATKKIMEESNCFTDSRVENVNRIIELNVFRVVPVFEDSGRRIYGSRFVQRIKIEETLSAFQKSRSIVQAYNDFNQGILMHSPTE